MKILNTNELDFVLDQVFKAAKRDMAPIWHKPTAIVKEPDFEAARKQIAELLKATKTAGGCLSATAILEKHRSTFQKELF